MSANTDKAADDSNNSEYQTKLPVIAEELPNDQQEY